MVNSSLGYRLSYLCTNSAHTFTLSIGIWNPPIMNICIPHLSKVIFWPCIIPFYFPKPPRCSSIGAKMFFHVSLYTTLGFNGGSYQNCFTKSSYIASHCFWDCFPSLPTEINKLSSSNGDKKYP